MASLLKLMGVPAAYNCLMQCGHETSPEEQAAFFAAVKEQDVDAISNLVLVAGVNLEATTGETDYTAITIAVEEDLEASLKRLIELGANVNAEDNDGSTAAISAAYNGKDALLKILLDAGADGSKADNSGTTPAHAAACCDHPACVRLLLAKNVDVTTANKGGFTPRNYVSSEGVSTGDHLLDAGRS